MDIYRITFHTIGRNDQHFVTTVNKATHYHILKNNRKIAEHSKLRNAVESIIENAGDNKELQDLIDHIFFLQNPETRYICLGITYGKQYGVKLEMKIADDQG
jgi:hypothetical protein